MKSGWETKRLGEVLTLEYGKPLPAKARKAGGDIPVYGANGIKAWTTTPYVHEAGIIVGRKGSAGEVNFSESPFWPLDVTYFVRFDQRQHHIQFLFYLLKALNLTALAKGIKPGLNRNEAYAKEVLIPSLAEQRRIVAILDEAFEGIAAAKANAEKNLRNARTVFESYRDATFTSLEQEASLKPLEEMVDDIATGPFGSLLHKSDYEEGGIPLVNPINIQNDAIVPDERKAVSATTANRLTRYRLKAGDIAVGRRGDIGRCAVVLPEQDGWLCGTGCFVIRAGKGVSPDFLAHLLRSRPYRMQLVAKAGRATMPSISNKDLADLQIPVLPPERQKNALEGFGELSAHSSQAEEVAVRKLTALDELKASLLHQAFTGAL